MLLAAGNLRKRFGKTGFSILETFVVVLFLSVILFTVSQIMTLIMTRSINALELTSQEDRGARFVSSITLATKTATAWGIYPDMNAYTNGPQSNLAPQGNVLVCNSATQTGAQILYVFTYDPLSHTLKRYENHVNTERMTLKSVLPTATAVFSQDLGLVQGHWGIPVRNQLLTFSAYGVPLRMR
jgi:hypothetical protein